MQLTIYPVLSHLIHHILLFLPQSVPPTMIVQKSSLKPQETPGSSFQILKEESFTWIYYISFSKIKCLFTTKGIRFPLVLLRKLQQVFSLPSSSCADTNYRKHSEKKRRFLWKTRRNKVTGSLWRTSDTCARIKLKYQGATRWKHTQTKQMPAPCTIWRPSSSEDFLSPPNVSLLMVSQPRNQRKFVLCDISAPSSDKLLYFVQSNCRNSKLILKLPSAYILPL